MTAMAHTLRNAGATLRYLLPQRSDWRTDSFQRDLVAGLSVGLVALPLALGFGVASGLGAGSGMITAIVAGIIAAVFGGSRVQVSGPTGAMAVILLPIVASHGADAVLVVGLMSSIVLLALGWMRAGRLINYMPVSVVEGFTLGIAIIIGLQQFPAALGLEPESTKVGPAAIQAVQTWLTQPNWIPLTSAALVVVIVVGFARLSPIIPWSLVAVALVTGLNEWLELGLTTIGKIPAGLPAPSLPSFGGLPYEQLVLPAIAVAALAALESLLSATVADTMTGGEPHNPDRELVGQGLANLAAPFFGGIPATAAIARTAVSVRSGASSRWASVIHGLFLLTVVLLLAPVVSRIPLAALAGILIATSIHMVRLRSIATIVRATRPDAAVLLLTAGATVALDLVTAVLVGLIAAGFFALRQVAASARLERMGQRRVHDLATSSGHQPRSVKGFRIDGALFFAAPEDFFAQLDHIKDTEVLVLSLRRVTTIDATGAQMLAEAIAGLEARGITVVLAEVAPHHRQVLEQFELTRGPHIQPPTPKQVAPPAAPAALEPPVEPAVLEPPTSDSA